MFASDRDLLALEPTVFRDVVWVGQRLVFGVGDVSGTTLTLTSGAPDFEDAGVAAGHVVVFDGAGYEVVDRLGATTLTISRLRGAASDPVIPPTPGSGLTVAVVSFGPQLALVHRQVLLMLGIDPDDAQASPGEGDIVNPGSLASLEAAGALHLVYAAAAALSDSGSPVAVRAGVYRERFAAERLRAAARIDLDGDGVADAIRRPSLVQLVRG